MSKMRQAHFKKLLRLDTGICFEPLEPRLLLSGSWGAAIDNTGADFHASTGINLIPETVLNHQANGLSLTEAQQRSMTSKTPFVDVLGRAAALKPLYPVNVGESFALAGVSPATGNGTSPTLGDSHLPAQVGVSYPLSPAENQHAKLDDGGRI